VATLKDCQDREIVRIVTGELTGRLVKINDRQTVAVTVLDGERTKEDARMSVPWTTMVDREPWRQAPEKPLADDRRYRFECRYISNQTGKEVRNYWTTAQEFLDELRQAGQAPESVVSITREPIA
jgi:hypothetical protein